MIIYNSDLSPFYRSAIGLDRLFNHLKNNQGQSNGGYPPYNIELVDENHYRTTITVTGFAESELETIVQDNLLVAKGVYADEQKERIYLYQGTAERNFERELQLAESVHIRGASLVSGLLYIDLERMTPEAKKPRRIEVSQSSKAAWRGLTFSYSPSGSIYESLDLQALIHFLEGEVITRNFDLSPPIRQWTGFDKLTSVLQNAGESRSFPPYNTEESDDNHCRITLALVGFRQEDLEIQLEGTRLSVKGTPEQSKKEKEWLHQGSVNQSFSLSFTLAENMEVSGAAFIGGLLRIDLIRNEPKPVAAQHIAVNERPALSN